MMPHRATVFTGFLLVFPDNRINAKKTDNWADNSRWPLSARNFDATFQHQNSQKNVFFFFCMVLMLLLYKQPMQVWRV
jgi:hypothetical protein